MKTKKLLVPYDPKYPERISEDHLTPAIQEGVLRLFGVRKMKESKLGLVAYVGVEVSKNDIFAEMIDRKWRIEDVDRQLELLQDYITALQDLKLGNVVKLTEGTDAVCFDLVAKRPQTSAPKLPG